MIKNKLNKLMKTYRPWSIGVSTKLSADNLFYPVQYDNELDLWFGVYRYSNIKWKEDIIVWRNGSKYNYYVLDEVKVETPVSNIAISQKYINECKERIKHE
jgi:hypothetical protein